jgi:hypothetical protein
MHYRSLLVHDTRIYRIAHSRTIGQFKMSEPMYFDTISSPLQRQGIRAQQLSPKRATIHPFRVSFSKAQEERMILLQTMTFPTVSGGLNTTAQVLIAILPLASVLVLGILTFFFMLWDHQKRILIINKGGTPVPRNINDKLLLLGIVSIFIGSGLVVFMSMYSGFSPSLLGGIVPATGGAGIVTYYFIIHRRTR